MATHQELPVFDHLALDFNKGGPRRAFMEGYFQGLGLWNADRVKEIRELCMEDVCTRLAAKSVKRVGQAYFEYYVDKKVWYNILGHANIPFEDHPWPSSRSEMPSLADLSEGASWYYQDWRLRKWSRPESQGESSKAPKSEASAKDRVTPGPQTQPAVAAETSQKSPAVAKDTVVRCDPSIPFASQARWRAAAAETARQSSVASAAPKPVLGQQAERPLGGQQAYGIGSSIWARNPPAEPKPPAELNPPAEPKPTADYSADVSKVTSSIAEIFLDVAAGKSAKKEKEKEHVAADAEEANAKAKRLYQKQQDAHAVLEEELNDIANKRFDIRSQKIAEAKAKAVADGCPEDDWQHFEEFDDRKAINPMNEPIPVRHDFGVNEVNWTGPMAPNPEYLEDIWDDLHLRKYRVGPICGPFEIALPKWMDFHDLVLGNDGSLFDMIEDEGLIDTDVMITWSVGNHGPISLIVGPKPTRKFDSQDKNQWLRVRNTWMKVGEWVAGVYKGHPHRLTDFLRYRQQQEIMGVSFMSLDDVVSLLVRLWDKISEDEEKAALEAQITREDLDLWIPQIHAILGQEYEYASQIAKAWVFRDGSNEIQRLRAIEYAWALFEPVQAYEWACKVQDEVFGRTN
ncbi:uncharacterized protein FSUBG_12337 [Fusarium subglutinans]|uniref:Uncharacterized protein n=1 Tax=Gibberella subglutinans TaxID=42677 RepID=A0A8H5L6D8_GIBSU|nr:uncharacterized protein FSUBG_12337 [Fusarium subglutinans]KAF5585748.1 hypothetical protein FSUBG_12337 [Fusarium subglutinans]